MSWFLNHHAVQHDAGAPQGTVVVCPADAYEEEVLPTQSACAHQLDISVPYLSLCKMRLK